MIYAFILEHKGHWPSRLMCSTLGVSSSGFYKWTQFVPGLRTLARNPLLIKIKTIHSEAKGRYGSPHFFTALRKRGRGGSLNMVANIMRENHIRAKQARKFRFTTGSNHAMPVAENQMDRRFDPSEPNKKGHSTFSNGQKNTIPNNPSLIHTKNHTYPPW